jgi:hypothetical protein
MKHIIPNLDPDDPAEFKEISPVDSFDFLEAAAQPPSPDYSELIDAAARAAEADQRKEAQKLAIKGAQERAAREFKSIADRIKNDTGYSVGYAQPWAYKPKAKVAYGLWKRVLPLFLEDPRILAMGATKLTAMLAANEPNFTIRRDMLYDPLNELAVRDVKRMLAKHGIKLSLRGKVTINSIRQELIDRRDAKLPVEKFSGRFEIKGDKVYINGKPYKVQRGASGKRRIQIGRAWLQLDALKEVCLGQNDAQ